MTRTRAFPLLITVLLHLPARKRETKHSPTTFPHFHPDASPMRLDQPSTDSQSQPRTPKLVGCRRFSLHAAECLEKRYTFARRDTWTAISNTSQYLLRPGLNAYVDR